MKKTILGRVFSVFLALIAVFTAIPLSVAFADSYFGEQWYATSNTAVYDSPSLSTQIGTIYQYEGYSILYRYPGTPSNPQWYAWVEYSTSSGPKRGYIPIWSDEYVLYTGLASVNTTSSLYYGNSSNGTYAVSGTVYSGEIVTILAKNDDWAYIEYNTISGRKRGYILYSKLDVYSRPNILPDLPCLTVGPIDFITSSQTVYAGPSTQYAAIGSVGPNEVIYVQSSYTYIPGTTYQSRYIEYYINGTSQKKSGYLVYGI